MKVVLLSFHPTFTRITKICILQKCQTIPLNVAETCQNFGSTTTRFLKTKLTKNKRRPGQPKSQVVEAVITVHVLETIN